MTRRESNKITYMYFITSVLVILIHSVNNDTMFQKFFSISGIGQFAVPLFFILSGFLFFRNIDTISDVKKKLKKRIYTLFAPYIIWNLIYYAIHLILNPGIGISITAINDAAFSYAYNPTFWFIQQLILLNAISFGLFYLLKDMKLILIIFIFMMLLVVFRIDIPYINEDAIIYYFSGATFSKLYNTNKIDFISKRNFVLTMTLTILLFALNRFLFANIRNDFTINLFTLSTILVRFSAALTIFYITDLFFNYDKTYSFMEHTFMLYAIHYMIVRAIAHLVQYVTFKLLSGDAVIIFETAAFICSPIICVTINYYLSRYLKTNFNKLYMTLTGNR